MKLIWGLEARNLLSGSAISSQDLWFGERRIEPKVTIDVLALFDGRLDELGSYSNSGLQMPDEFVRLFWDRLDHYMDMYDRTEYGRMSSYTARRDQLFLLGHCFYAMLRDKQIDYAFFVSPPHFGMDALLADLCVYLNIPVYYGYQSLFPNRFFILDHLYRIVPSPQQALPDIALPPVECEQLFYMQCIKSKRRSWVDLVGVWLRYMLGKVARADLAYAFKRVIRQVQYQKQLREYTNLSGTIEQIEARLQGMQYVYFPLHLQPEMTTSNLGGAQYRDQAQAIQDVLDVLPDGWFLIIKENPKQDWQYRSDAFWRSIMGDKRILLINIATPSKLLIKYCQIVATISGTVGWEAVRYSKPVLCMGKCWFSTLHGVFEFKSDVDLNNLKDFKINHEKLQKSFNQLLSYSWPGVIDLCYHCLCNDIQLTENAASLDGLLKSLPLPPSQASF